MNECVRARVLCVVVLHGADIASTLYFDDLFGDSDAHTCHPYKGLKVSE